MVTHHRTIEVGQWLSVEINTKGNLLVERYWVQCNFACYDWICKELGGPTVPVSISRYLQINCIEVTL